MTAEHENIDANKLDSSSETNRYELKIYTQNLPEDVRKSVELWDGEISTIPIMFFNLKTDGRLIIEIDEGFRGGASFELPDLSLLDTVINELKTDSPKES